MAVSCGAVTGVKENNKKEGAMIPVLVILGLMCFTWIVAVYATNVEDPQQEARLPERDGKAA